MNNLTLRMLSYLQSAGNGIFFSKFALQKLAEKKGYTKIEIERAFIELEKNVQVGYSNWKYCWHHMTDTEIMEAKKRIAFFDTLP